MDPRRQLRLSMLFISRNLAVVKYVSDITALTPLGRIVERGSPGACWSAMIVTSADHRTGTLPCSWAKRRLPLRPFSKRH
jgi:ABC-type glutathione transport system ATPase component